MEEKIKLLNDLFEVELSLDDLNREVERILPWDSFHILGYLIEIYEQYHKKITVEQISEVKYVHDLLELMEDK